MSEALAIAAAFCAALSAMLVGELRGRMSVLRLCFWQQTTALAFTAALSLAFENWQFVTLHHVLLLSASSLTGVVVASLAYVGCIHQVGPQIAGLLFALTIPFTLVFGYLILGETVSHRQGLGILLVLSGVMMAIGLPNSATAMGRHSRAPEHTMLPAWMSGLLGSPLAMGVGIGLIAALGQAAGILFARPVMADGVGPFAAMSIRLVIGTVLFLPFVMRAGKDVAGNRLDLFTMGLIGGSGLVGFVLGMSLQMAALRGGDAAIVVSLSSISPLIVLPMIWMRTGSVPPLRAWLGGVLVISGTTLTSI